jgi:hypothetical protein
VIDNTNADVPVRSEYVAIAKNLGVKNIRCIYFSTPRDVANHLNLFREFIYNVRRIPDIAYNMFNKRFEMPTTKEGFTKVEEIPFGISFDKPEHRELFCHWQ